MALRYTLPTSKPAVPALRREARAAARERIGERVIALMSLAEGDEVMIREIVCGDAACPGLETLILVARSKRRATVCRIPSAMTDVGEADLRAALPIIDQKETDA